MRPTEQPSPPSTRPEPRPEPAGPGSKSCDVAAPQAEGGREPASQWEGYDLLVHVPIVESLSPDGVRSPDPGFQQAVEDRLVQEIEARGLPVLSLDVTARAGWLDAVEQTVWERLRPAQLPLL